MQRYVLEDEGGQVNPQIGESIDVTNIFRFVRPPSEKVRQIEDGLSISFGFLLYKDKKLRENFLSRIELPSSRRGKLRIRTQKHVNPKESAETGRLDLELECPNEFLVILESKIVEHKPENIKQLKKYASFINEKREFYGNVRLVYVTKFGITDNERKRICDEVNLKRTEFVSFSWQELIELVSEGPSTFNKLFNEWIGDKMSDRKLISAQSVDDVVEVRAVYTDPCFMKLLEENNKIVQSKGSPDAMYIAVIQTHREGGSKSAITHICKVNETRIETAAKSWEKCSAIEEYRSKVGDKTLNWENKAYLLDGKPKKLFREIPMRGGKGQVAFNTTFLELITRETGKEMRTTGQLKDGFCGEK